MNLREAILGAADTKVMKLAIPEWGCEVYLRVMTGAERDAFEMATAADPKSGRRPLINVRARFAAIVLSDESGKRLFTDADIPALTQKSAQALDRILEAGMKFNGVRDEDVEALEGKSGSGQSGDSGTK